MPDTAMNLVMQPHFLISDIVIASKLNTVHAHVGASHTRIVRVFGIHLWQSHISPTIHGPGHELRQLRDGGLVLHDRPGGDLTRHGMVRGFGRTKILPRSLERFHGRKLELHQPLHHLNGVTEDEMHAFSGAE